MHEYIKMMQERLLPALENETLAKQYTWWLLEKVTGKAKSDLLMHEQELTGAMQTTLEGWLDDIAYHHKPIGYILQEVPFCDVVVKVRPPILIPRPETEEWVHHLITEIKKSGAKNLRILDMCTGSGCIALALSKALPDAQLYAADISAFAIFLVDENKKKLDLPSIVTLESDLFSAVPQGIDFDLIVTNPPYISDKEFARLDPSVKNWEESRALLAEDNGLAVISKIVHDAYAYLRPNALLKKQGIGQLYIEIGYQQGSSVQQVLRSAGYADIKIMQDSAHKDRLVSGSIEDVAATEMHK